MPNVEKVYGFDIDYSILFNQGKISTFYLDQTNEKSWEEIKKRIPKDSIDLFIDDGLHSPLANIIFLNNVYYFIKSSGYIVIEDIDYQSLPFWKLILCLNQNFWKFEIAECNYKLMLIGHKI